MLLELGDVSLRRERYLSGRYFRKRMLLETLLVVRDIMSERGRCLR